MLSRICHPNDEVYKVVEAIIMKVLSAYPSQVCVCVCLCVCLCCFFVLLYVRMCMCVCVVRMGCCG